MATARKTIPLASIRTDGWFERLGANSPEFGQLCKIIGEKFLGFSVIVGLRIQTVTLDRKRPEGTRIDHTIGDDPTVHQVSIVDFRERLVVALASPATSAADESLEQGNTADVQRVLGVHNVLLAGLYGYRLDELQHTDGGDIHVAFHYEQKAHVLALRAFHELLRERVRAEAVAVAPAPAAPFTIDLARLPQAEAALSAGNYARTVELLGAWIGPLSLLLRTGEGQQLAPNARQQLARALGMLGTAYARQARHEDAEQVLRLGIQWGQDGQVAGELFRRLAETYMSQGRHGEGIGLLRRATALGDDPREVLPLLAQCFVARKRFVAAMACVERAISAGVDPLMTDASEKAALAVLGDHWANLRGQVPTAADLDTYETMPAAGPK